MEKLTQKHHHYFNFQKLCLLPQKRIEKKNDFILLIFLVICISFFPSYILAPQPPQIMIGFTPNTGPAPLEVEFDSSQSSSPSGNIHSYHWEFGDGNETYGAIVKHTFWNIGNYSVHLTIIDNLGISASATIQISVVERESPLAAFSYSIGNQNFKINFDAGYSVSNHPIIKYNWNFGDSDSGHSMIYINTLGPVSISPPSTPPPQPPQKTTSHTYPAPGEYTVVLTVTDDKGVSNEVSRKIKVLRNGVSSENIDDEDDLLKGTSGGSPSSTSVLRIDLSKVTLWNQQINMRLGLRKLGTLMITNRSIDSLNANSILPMPFTGLKIDALLFSKTKCRNASSVAFIQQDPKFSRRNIFVSPGSNPLSQQINTLSQTSSALFGIIGGGVDDSIVTLDTIDANASRINPYGFVTLGFGETLIIQYLDCPDILLDNNMYLYLCAIVDVPLEFQVNFFDEIIPIEDLIDLKYINIPPISSFTISPEKPLVQEIIRLDGSASKDPDGLIGFYVWSFGDGASGTGKSIEHRYDQPGNYTITLTTWDNGGGRTSYKKNISVLSSSTSLPNPTSFAPSLDPTIATNFQVATEFLYSGANPVQRNMNPDVIESKRAAVLRGQVQNQDGSPLAGIKIIILNHPEYGWTMSGEDGIFNMVVNGGSQLAVQYEKFGYLKIQRHILVPWQDYVWLPNVVLLPFSEKVSTIRLGNDSEIQLVQGKEVMDSDGSRQSTLVIPQELHGELILPDGSNQSVDNLNIRITEFSVGKKGPLAMPAELPPSTGYTYAFEISADEAEAIGAEDVHFDKPIIHYVENFLNFPVGLLVPTGYFNRKKGVWIPSENGIVVKLLDTNNDGLVDALDSTGDRFPEDLNGNGSYIDEVAGLQDPIKYPPDGTFWRVPITHFTPWDCNWPYGPPTDAQAPSVDIPSEININDPCKKTGHSIIGLQNQFLGESIPITGTNFSLNYQSERVEGYSAANSLTIPLSRTSVPESLKRIDLEVYVAGQRFMLNFSALPNQSYKYIWDRKDAYGRVLHGAQSVNVKIGYIYDAFYQQPSQLNQNFGQFSGVPITGSRSRQEITLWKVYSTILGSLNNEPNNLGGWTLNIHNVYDPFKRVLYLGNGQSFDYNAKNIRVVNTYAGSGVSGFSGDGGPAIDGELSFPYDVTTGSDGSLYIIDNNRIRRVSPDGIISTVAGGGDRYGDGGPATEAELVDPITIEIGPDGSIYICGYDNRIRRIFPGADHIITGSSDEIIITVAGSSDPYNPYNAENSFSGDGGLATQAILNYPGGLAVGPDGSLYIADTGNSRIRKVSPDGIITTIAGTDLTEENVLIPPIDGIPAINAVISLPEDVEISKDGNIYIIDFCWSIVRRIGPDGIINTVAGSVELGPGFSGDLGPAIQAQLDFPHGIAISPDDNLYIADFLNGRIRKVSANGIISTFAGCGTPGIDPDNVGFSGDGGPANEAHFNFVLSVAIGQDASIYIVDSSNHRIRRVSPPLSGQTNNEFAIPNKNTTQIFLFDEQGRHSKTINALNGTVIYSFKYDAYDGKSLLTSIEDADGNTTRIEREEDGKPKEIVSPYNQKSLLTFYEDGYLKSIANPANEVTKFTYKNGAPGLLETIIDPKSNVYSYEYDDMGRLGKFQDPPEAGGFSTLIRTETAMGYSVSRTTAMGRNTTYHVERLPEGGTRLVNQFSCCNQTEVVDSIDGTRKITSADGTVITKQKEADPRWGMSALISKKMTIKTPSGLTLTANMNRNVTLLDPNNPLSLSTLTDIIEINERTYKIMYDASTGKITKTSPEGRQDITILDSKGYMSGRQLTGLAPISLNYDSRGRSTSIQFGLDSAYRRQFFLQYDIVPNDDNEPDRLIDPENNILKFEKYDFAGRLKILKLPDSNQVLFDYDANGELISLTPPGRPTHTFTKTAVNLLKDYIPPNVGSTSNATRFDYNYDRQIDLITRPDGMKIDYIYDTTSSHINEIKFIEGTTEIDNTVFTYYPITHSSAGKLLSIVNSNSETQTFAYDGFLPISCKWEGTINGSVEHAYSNDFIIESETINGDNEIKYIYDGDGLIKQAGSLILSRDDPSDPETKNGFLRGTTLSKVTTSLRYNLFGELKDYIVTFNDSSSPSTIFENHYPIRDNLGRIKEKNELIDGIQTTYKYDYDNNGRLWKVFKNGILKNVYKYDSNSNLLIFKSDGTVDVEYDDQDRLKRYGSTSYTYNANGELKSKTDSSGQTEYTYDLYGALVQVNLPGGRVVKYIIDGQHRRIGKKVDNVLVKGFIYRSWLAPAAELDGSNNVVSRFVYSTRENVPDYMIRSGITYRIITDQVGSVRLVVNASTGAITQRIDYDEFGVILQDTNPGFQPFGFAGGIYDPDTGFLRFCARDYDPHTHRWTAKDPLLYFGDDTNFYGYTKEDPINYIDETGTQSEGIGIEYYFNWRTWVQAFKDCGRILLGENPYEPDEEGEKQKYDILPCNPPEQCLTPQELEIGKEIIDEALRNGKPVHPVLKELKYYKQRSIRIQLPELDLRPYLQSGKVPNT